MNENVVSPPIAGHRQGSWWSAILRQSCPRCGRGALSAGAGRMNPVCPACGLRLIREEGWFLLAMYFTYAMAIPLLIALTFGLWWLLGWHLHVVVFVALGIFVLLVPLLVRYSRVLAIHFDYLVDPTPWRDAPSQ